MNIPSTPIAGRNFIRFSTTDFETQLNFEDERCVIGLGSAAEAFVELSSLERTASELDHHAHFDMSGAFWDGGAIVADTSAACRARIATGSDNSEVDLPLETNSARGNASRGGVARLGNIARVRRRRQL